MRGQLSSAKKEMDAAAEKYNADCGALGFTMDAEITKRTQAVEKRIRAVTVEGVAMELYNRQSKDERAKLVKQDHVQYKMEKEKVFPRDP